MAERAHFHIWRGISYGYTPELDMTCETLRDARERLADIKDEYREWQAETAETAEPLRVSGDVRRHGCVQIYDPAGAFIRQAFIEPCYLPECADETDF